MDHLIWLKLITINNYNDNNGPSHYLVIFSLAVLLDLSLFRVTRSRFLLLVGGGDSLFAVI